MRIIAGSLRGRTFLPPASQVTRPVTDRVKQSIFDILAPMIDGAIVYDCFSGTGSMGLESLSRGAAAVTFFEVDRSAIKILRENIRALAVDDRSTVVTIDLFKWFSQSTSRVASLHAGRSVDEATASPECGQATRKVDLIFLDPPYRMLRENHIQLQTLTTQLSLRLSDNGLVVFRHDKADELTLLPLQIADCRTYGSMTVEFLRK